jgi:uncharacterized protein
VKSCAVGLAPVVRCLQGPLESCASPPHPNPLPHCVEREDFTDLDPASPPSPGRRYHPPAMYFALLYETVPDHVERRKPFRDEHLALAREHHAAGKLLLAGAFAEPAEGALLVFRCDSADEVEEFVRRDPYVRNGLVTSWRIRPWTVVIGGEAAA